MIHAVGLPMGFGMRDGIVFFRSPQAATAASVAAFFDGLRAVASAGSNLVVDVRDWKTIDAAARRVLYERGRELHGMRIAAVISTRLQHAMIVFSGFATGNQIRCFSTMGEAMAWLKR